MINEMSPFISEFNNRKRLSALGFGDFIENLDAYTAECFIELSQHYAKLESDKLKNSMSGV